jgi:hypothetical protein
VWAIRRFESDRSRRSAPHRIGRHSSHYFKTFGDATHDFKFGFGYGRTDIFSQTIYPGNGAVAYENSATDFRARLYREGAGANRAEYLNLYLGDTIAMDRLTVDLGVRQDQQGGRVLPSQTQPDTGFPTLVPGIDFAGYEASFTWRNVSPHGVTYAVDEARKSILRASMSRNAGQMTSVGVYIGYANPSSRHRFLLAPSPRAPTHHRRSRNPSCATRPSTWSPVSGAPAGKGSGGRRRTPRFAGHARRFTHEVGHRPLLTRIASFSRRLEFAALIDGRALQIVIFANESYLTVRSATASGSPR